MVVTGGWGWVSRENGALLLFNRYRVSAGKDEKVLEVDGVDGCPTVFMPLNCKLMNGYNGQSYVSYI